MLILSLLLILTRQLRLMTNTPNNSADSQNYETNIELSYDYLEKAIKEVQDVINNNNTQLGILIGFNFTFIRFFINELPTRVVVNENSYFGFCNSCLLLRILAYLFSVSSIIYSLVGLYQTTDLKIIKPDVLRQNCDRVLNWELKLAIFDQLKDKLENFRKLARQKKQILNRSILLLLASGLMAIIDEIIAAIFY